MSQASEYRAGGGEQRAAAAPYANLLRVGVVESAPGVLVLTPVGELDVTSAGLLRDAARDALATRPRCVVINLAGLKFCGSTGLAVLLDARHDAEAVGVRFGTADGSPIVRRVLEITELGPALGHRETVADVVADQGS
ncbi:stage II sporulation protein AA (anti-sigma F factor antagonist) [Pseudonocardia hierapolitana]|uniref:Anti-sigma factor antagonist n=1 Tax=Pseudonocardia hierapolitana TaxID=1128676 RepID=A0A561SJV4_9PSEU|nr:STAS domain-containing protein [Pseudonocardia hierapolitana]TWF75176.1 stage II sporulation protein AA (anti-sigma F factor antagonist) [Pseudonocardia hierapolitana]